MLAMEDAINKLKFSWILIWTTLEFLLQTKKISMHQNKTP